MGVKLIVANDSVFKYFVEYMNTFAGYTVIVKSQLDNYDLSECEELIAVQRGDWLPSHIFKTGPKISIANTEQLCDDTVENRVNQELLDLEHNIGNRITVYDYSLKNIEILSRLGFQTKYHPYISPLEEINRLGIINKQPKKYNVGFVGAVNDRRKKILDELQDRGITVKLIQSFGNERDNELAECKYILNIHWAAHFNIFESIRCNRLLQAKFNVITEDSIEIIDSDYVYSTPYNELTNFIYNKIKTDHSIDAISSYIKTCYKPQNESEFSIVDRFDMNVYNSLIQDGIMIVRSNALVPAGRDKVSIGEWTIIRKNYPRELDWLQEGGSVQFNNTAAPLYRRHIPPPIETIDHVFLISKVISATSNNDKNYIEYGVRNGTSVEPISKLVKNAYAVDIVDYVPTSDNIHFFKMLTDEFSANNLETINFDYAFIDADHSSKQVLTDFINIYNYINKGGYIFLHDTYPCSEIFLRSDYCNDCYLSPIKIRELYPNIEMLTIPINPGLTIIRKI
jgi:hypothetical protein